MIIRRPYSEFIKRGQAAGGGSWDDWARLQGAGTYREWLGRKQLDKPRMVVRAVHVQHLRRQVEAFMRVDSVEAKTDAPLED
jgi:hypothetical protein